MQYLSDSDQQARHCTDPMCADMSHVPITHLLHDDICSCRSPNALINCTQAPLLKVNLYREILSGIQPSARHVRRDGTEARSSTRCQVRTIAMV